MNAQPYWGWPPHRPTATDRPPVNEQAARDAAAASLMMGTRKWKATS